MQKNIDAKIVLKGGAATQFYLDINRQRTSTHDFLALREEIENVLRY